MQEIVVYGSVIISSNNFSNIFVNLGRLEKNLKDNHQPKFRLEQIKKAIYQDGADSFLEISTTPKDLRDKLDKELKILSFEIEKVLVSKDGKSIKALLKIPCHTERIRQLEKPKNLIDLKLDPSTGLGMTYFYIETVLLSPRPDNWTACISSQVGCPLGCAFCATGKMGFNKNLTAEEITDQILFWRQYMKNNFKMFENCDVSNIVYMGMGEPFLNWNEVRKSLDDLINPKLFNFGSRSISVSTVGVPEGIEKFTEQFPQVNLAISLHFADDKLRSQFMPANKNYNLENLREDLKKYFRKSKRKVFMEYIMFQGLNDSFKDADKLIKYLNSIGNSYLLHVNLISYNVPVIPSPVEESNIRSSRRFAPQDDNILFKPSSKEKIIKFRNYLLQNKINPAPFSNLSQQNIKFSKRCGINATIRKSLGQEISGACGQLAGI